MILWLKSLRIQILCLMLKLWLVIFQLLPVNLWAIKADLTCQKPEKGKDLRRRVRKVVLANQKLTDKHLISTVAALVGPWVRPASNSTRRQQKEIKECLEMLLKWNIHKQNFHHLSWKLSPSSIDFSHSLSSMSNMFSIWITHQLILCEKTLKMMMKTTTQMLTEWSVGLDKTKRKKKKRKLKNLINQKMMMNLISSIFSSLNVIWLRVDKLVVLILIQSTMIWLLWVMVSSILTALRS